MFDFIHFSYIEIVDIAIVALLIYWILRIVRGTAAGRILLFIVFLCLCWVVAKFLKLELLSFILGQVLGVGVIALIIIFQPEIRRFLLHLGQQMSRSKVLGKMFRRGSSEGMSRVALEELTASCQRMSETKTGALIVMPHKSNLSEIIETGDTISAEINRRLIENIFFKNTPLHDGAMIMGPDKIIAARCTLPISDRQDIPPRYGMRHRAAIGVTERTDASVVVVSEETGEISFVSGGEIKTMSSLTELRLAIENSYN